MFTPEIYYIRTNKKPIAKHSYLMLNAYRESAACKGVLPNDDQSEKKQAAMSKVFLVLLGCLENTQTELESFSRKSTNIKEI